MKNLIQIHNNDFEANQDNLYLYFKSGENNYAIKVRQVIEVMKLPKLEYPQRLPNNIVGLLNYNTFTLNVLDLRFYLHINVSSYSTSSQLVVVKTDEAIFALIVDKIEDIIYLNSAQIEAVALSCDENIIEAIYRDEVTNISIINLYALEKTVRNAKGLAEIDIPALFPSDAASELKMAERTKKLCDKAKFDVADFSCSNDKFISFSLNGGNYCINLEFVNELLKNVTFTQIPCAPDYIVGVITLRGDFITLVDLKKFLELQCEDCGNDPKSVIVVQGEGFRIGFVVDEIFKIMDISEDIMTGRNFAQSKFIKSEVLLSEKLFEVIDVKKILSDDRFFIEQN